MQLKQKGIRFAIHTLGCKVNTYESDAMAEKLRAAGLTECGFEETADVYVINTCTVTNIADRKSRQMLRRARRLNPDALIVAAGCYVDDAVKNERLEELISDRVIDVAVSNKDKNKIVELINERINIFGDNDLLKPEKFQDNPFITELDGHSRAFIKVQDGCNMYCSYCIIPYVRGPLKRRPLEDIAKEVGLLAESRTAEIVITGIHLSSLGNGILDIISEIEKFDGIKRVRLGSLEPKLITEEFAAELASHKKLCPHFHLSLQSGNDEILKKMNRHYTAEEYAQRCGILRKAFDHPAITTDIIVGFPGETEAQFESTCAFAERIGFYEAHIFKYSRRRGTPADRMDGQLSDAQKSARSERLMEICGRMSHDFRQYYIGKEVSFLSEELVSIGGRTYETGFTPEYVRCLRPSSEVHQNEIISGKASQIIHENVIDEALLLV
ncbi:MAG: tRNA (N(6)-L-threonylcarbamoyladenosine(37)-C(2))-methylthiotransferase MtaB [Clostridiales bacterium]|nr:tRNA (N(6)-L-threonylcarbamoyladenosine(37)-C(2))-methylthiotransferase MtaB [Clostridiales bacterium]